MREQPPEYTAYSIEDLIDARRHINEEAFPERVQELDRLIARRQIAPTTGVAASQPIETTESPSQRKPRLPPQPRVYRGLLFGTLFVLLAINTATLIATRNLVPVVAIIVQTAVVLCAASRARVAVWVIRGWAALLIAGGTLGWVSILAAAAASLFTLSVERLMPPHLTWFDVLANVVLLAAGVWFFRHAGQIREPAADGARTR